MVGIKLKIFILFLSIVLIFSPGIFAIEKNNTNASFDSPSNITDQSIKNDTIIKSGQTKKSIPTSYDLRTLGKLTPVKNQEYTGTCWIFASLASLESCLLPQETWDFSENNIKNLLSNLYPQGFDRDYNGGGNWNEVMAYLSRYSGPVAESEDPFNPSSGISPILTPLKHVQEMVLLPPRNNSLDNHKIKLALMDYGAVYTVMDFISEYFNPFSNSYYKNQSSKPNHSICIVGWDDNYNKNNFLNPPSDNGAFIIRNSWGSYWGEGGYFYVSYYDAGLAYGDDNVVFVNASPISNYKKVYQYDPFGEVDYDGFNSDTAWFANVFKSNSNDTLGAVSFYVISENSNYELYVYLDPEEGNPKNGSLVAYKNGTISTRGYKTINLDKYIQIPMGHKFSVVVKMKSPGSISPIAIEYAMPDYSSKATANAGESYVSPDGIEWLDETTRFTNGNVCLKAFTVSYADLFIQKIVDNANPVVGSEITFTISVENKGPDDSSDVKVRDLLQPGLAFLSYNSTCGTYDSDSGVWTIGILPYNSKALLTIKCLVNAGESINNQAKVNSSTYDPDPYNNNVTLTIYPSVVNPTNLMDVNHYITNSAAITMKNTGTSLLPLLISIVIINILIRPKR